MSGWARGLSGAAFAAALLCAGPAGATEQGLAFAGVTPSRDGRGAVLVEVRDAQLLSEIDSPALASRFNVLLKAGEAKVTQATRVLAAGERQYTMLAFDQSGSFRMYMPDALAGAHRFVDALPTGKEGAVAVVSFGAVMSQPQVSTTKADAHKALDALTKAPLQQVTRLKSSIVDAIAHVATAQPMPQGLRHVVVFTDAGEESNAYDVTQVIKRARDLSVRVSVVVLGNAMAGGATMAQRRDEMKRLAEESGGTLVEAQKRELVSQGLEQLARSGDAVVRLSLAFCGVPAQPVSRDDELRVEVNRGGALAAFTDWETFHQQASGKAIEPCAGAAASPSSSPSAPSPAASVQPSAQVAGPSPARLLWFGAGAAGLGALVVVAALLSSRRDKKAARPRAQTPLPEPARPPEAVIPQDHAGGSRRPDPLEVLPETRLVIEGATLPQGQVVRVSHSPFSVGGGPYVDLRIDVPELSGHHATFELYRNGSLYITDNRSKNGTFVGGRRLEPGERVALSHGSQVTLSSRVRVRVEQPSRPSSMAPPSRRGAGP